MNLTGKAVVLTGATTGIGRATALALADQPARLIVHGPQAAREVSDLMHSLQSAMQPGAELAYLRCDYGHLAGVAQLARDIRSSTDCIDALINNAARPGAPSRTLSADGNEITWQTNYLAPVALTTLVLDLVGRDRPGRIVNGSSATHLSAELHLDDLDLARHAYSPVTAYAQSKLALVTYSCWLARHLPRPSIEVVSMHPGVIATTLLHEMFAAGGDRPEHAASNILEVVAHSGDNGTYYDEQRPARPNPTALDAVVQDRLHQLTSAALAAALP
jgi:NAD(P)-dependent dehydrogenase (short-subunit alcohol dehydrogenase family)